MKKEVLYKIHEGCCFKKEELTAIWSEKYSDPKLDQECYLVRVMFKNNCTILTIAHSSSKKEADKMIKEINKT